MPQWDPAEGRVAPPILEADLRRRHATGVQCEEEEEEEEEERSLIEDLKRYAQFFLRSCIKEEEFNG